MDGRIEKAEAPHISLRCRHRGYPGTVAVALLVILWTFAQLSCPNPLLDVIQSAAISVTLDGNPVGEGKTVDIGLVRTDLPHSLVFTIANVGNARLSLTSDPGVQIAGDDPASASTFSLASPPASAIDIKATTQFVVQCAPTSDGLRGATFRIGTNTGAGQLSFRISLRADGINMGVESMSPPDGSTSVAVNTPVSAVFAEPMDPFTITTSSFTLRNTDSGLLVSGNVSYDSSTGTALFTPGSNLAVTSHFLASLKTTITDLVGNPLSERTWTFITSTITDNIPPAISSRDPAPDATGVRTNAVIIAEFDEPLLATSVSASSFVLMKASLPVSGTVSYETLAGHGRVRFCPDSLCSAGAAYAVSIPAGGIKDLAGNAIQNRIDWVFMAGSGPVTGPLLWGLGFWDSDNWQ